MLQKVEINGFRGMHKAIGFDKQRTVISGHNGCGKSTIIDAIRWCFASVDTSGLKNRNIFDNNFDPNKEEETISVICTIERNGIACSFKRQARRKVGADTEYKYFIDDIDCATAFPYKKSIERTLCDATILDLALNIRYWDTLSEKDMRDLLTSIFQEGDIIGFDDIKKRLELVPLPAYRTSIKKSINEDEDNLRTLQVEHDLLSEETPAFIATKEIADKLAQKERELKDCQEEKIPDEIIAASKEAAAIHSKAIAAYQDAEITYVTTFRRKMTEIQEILNGIEHNKGNLKALEEDVNYTQTRIDALFVELTELKEQYDNAIRAEFDKTCPTCGHALEGEVLAQFEQTFNANKKKNIDNIVNHGKSVRAHYLTLLQSVKDKKEEISKYKKCARADAPQLKEEYLRLSTLSKVPFADTKEGMELNMAITEAKDKLQTIQWSSTKDTFIKELQSEITQLHIDLNEATNNNRKREELLERIAKNNESQKAVAEIKLKHECELEMLKNYEIAVLQSVEDNINALLPDGTQVSLYCIKDDTIKAQCKISYKGVKDTMNTAARNIVGLRLAESLLCDADVPILIDNAEAFDSDNIPFSTKQLILACVADGDMKIESK